MSTKTTFEYLRESALNKHGLSQYDHDDSPQEVRKDIAEKKVLADKCLRLAKNRLKMGTYRYGVANHNLYDYRSRLFFKLLRYDETGNKEYLIDVINYCVLEFGWPNREGTYFEAVDDDPKSKRSYDL